MLYNALLNKYRYCVWTLIVDTGGGEISTNRENDASGNILKIATGKRYFKLHYNYNYYKLQAFAR